MKKMPYLLPALLLAPLAVSAIELSLEENKADRGNIGYIDMQRLFKTFPDTIRAKENFEELVRQAEEQLNLRKAEILRLRNELAQMRVEREFLARTPIEIPKPPKSKPDSKPEAAQPETKPGKAAETRRPAHAPLVEVPRPAQPSSVPTPPEDSAAAAAAAAAAKDAADVELNRQLQQAQQAAPPLEGRRRQEPETDLTRPSIANLPGFGEGADGPAAPLAPPGGAAEENKAEAADQARKAEAAKAAEPKAREPLVIDIPGVSTAPIVVAPPPPAAPSVTVSTPAAAPKAEPSKPDASNPALVELDARIAVKAQELAKLEAEYKELQLSSEKNLLELESRRTELLLGKIHRAVQDVARKEGVSVIVDKSSILYGHDAVDLTEKVMKHLKGI